MNQSLDKLGKQVKEAFRKKEFLKGSLLAGFYLTLGMVYLILDTLTKIIERSHK